MKAFGIILMTLGFLALTYAGFGYTPSEELPNLASLDILTQNHRIDWLAPIVGVIDLMIGFSLLFAPKTWI